MYLRELRKTICSQSLRLKPRSLESQFLKKNLIRSLIILEPQLKGNKGADLRRSFILTS